MSFRTLLLLLSHFIFSLPCLTEASTHAQSGHALHGALAARDSADPGGCENLSGKRLIVPNEKTVTSSGTFEYKARGLGGETLAAYLGTSQDEAYHSNGAHWNTLNKGMLTSYQEDTLGSGACRYEDWILPPNLPRVALGSYGCAGATLDNPLNIYKDGAGCGMCLVIYTQRERRVAIATNECPHCPGGMDMEQQFWNTLEGDGRTERQLFEWSIVPCTEIFQGGLVIVFGPDSQRYYMRFQVRLATYPVIAMSWAFPNSNEWKPMTFSSAFFTITNTKGIEGVIRLKLVCMNGQVMFIDNYQIPTSAPHSSFASINFGANGEQSTHSTHSKTSYRTLPRHRGGYGSGYSHYYGGH